MSYYTNSNMPLGEAYHALPLSLIHFDGKRLPTTNTADLPKGIYVINGKKVVVK